jgi:hypothetical protein
MSRTRIKALRLLTSRLAQDTTTTLNATTRKRMRIIFHSLSKAHPTSPTTGKGNMVLTAKES